MRASRAITLTLLASVSAVAVTGCGRDEKREARREQACRRDPGSEDCLDGGQSHSSGWYFFHGSGAYGQPAGYTRSNAAYGARPFSSGSSNAAGSAPTSEGTFSPGTVTEGVVGSSAAAYAGGEAGVGE